jgi:serine/threonine protein kinase
MTPQNPHYDIAYRIDSICLQFADQLRQSTTGADRPSIESLLQQHSDLPRQQLLECLLSEELEYLTVQGQKPDANRLRQRFPQDHAIIDKALSRNPVKQAVPDECATQLAPADAASEGSQPKKKHPRVSTPAPHISGFDMLEGLGEGGMGAVFQAYDRRYKRTVAIKIIHRRHQANPQIKLRFENEIFALKRLSHANIVRVHESGEKDEVLYYSMDYVDGLNLELLIRAAQQAVNQRRNTATAMTPHQAADSTLPPDPASAPLIRKGSSSGNHKSAEGAIEYPSEDFIRFCTQRSRTENHKATKDIVQIGIDVANAMQHAHDAGVIHRDLKPNNLLLDKNGRIWVADFGLAQAQDATPLTMTGHVHGTLKYMSPEQLLGGQVSIDRCTDMYSLGATLYELLCLEPVREGNNSQEIRNKVAFGEPVSLRRRNPAIPRDLETIIHKAISHRPRDRYQTMQELSDDLRRFQRHEPILAKPAGPLKRLSLWVEREQKLAAALAASAALLLIVLGLLLVQVHGKLDETQTARNQEQQLRYAAERREKTAQAHRLALASLEQKETDPGLAYLLARQAQKLSPDAIPEATTAAVEALRRSHEVCVWHPLEKPTPVITSAVRPHGIEFSLVTADPGGKGQLLHLSDPMTGQTLQTIKLQGVVQDLEWNPAGTTLIVLSEKLHPTTNTKDLHLHAYTFNSATRRLSHAEALHTEGRQRSLDNPPHHRPTIEWSAIGNVILLCDGRALTPLHAGRLRRSSAPSLTFPECVRAATIAPDGRFVCLTDTSISIISQTDNQPKTHSTKIEPTATFPENTPIFTFIDDSRFLVNHNDGLILIDISQPEPKLLHRYPERHAHFTKSEGQTILYGYSNEAVIYNSQFDTPVDSFSVRQPLRCIKSSDSQQELWLLTYRSDLYLKTQETLIRIPLPRSSHTNPITDLDILSSENAVATHENGQLTTLRSTPLGDSYKLAQRHDSAPSVPRPVFRHDSAAIVVADEPIPVCQILPLSANLPASDQLPGRLLNNNTLTDTFTTVDKNILYFTKQGKNQVPQFAGKVNLSEPITFAQHLTGSENVLFLLNNGTAGLLKTNTNQITTLTPRGRRVSAVAVSDSSSDFVISTTDGSCTHFKCTTTSLQSHELPTKDSYETICFSKNTEKLFAAGKTGRVDIFTHESEVFTFTNSIETNIPNVSILKPSFDNRYLFIAAFGDTCHFQVSDLQSNSVAIHGSLAVFGNLFPEWDRDTQRLWLGTRGGLSLLDPRTGENTTIHKSATYGVVVRGDSLYTLEPKAEWQLFHSETDPFQPQFGMRLVQRKRQSPEEALTIHTLDGECHYIRAFASEVNAVLVQKTMGTCSLHSPRRLFAGRQISGFDSRIIDARFISNSTRFVTLSASGVARICDTENENLHAMSQPIPLCVPPPPLHAIADDGSTVFFVDTNENLCVWETESGSRPRVLRKATPIPVALSTDPRGRLIVSIYNSYLLISDPRANQSVLRFDIAASAIVWSGNGNFLVVLCTNGTIYRLDLVTQVMALLEVPFEVHDVCISRDSSEIVALSKSTDSGGKLLETDVTISHIFFFRDDGTHPHRTIKMAGVTGIRAGFNNTRLLCQTADAVMHLDLSGASPSVMYRFPDVRLNDLDATDSQGIGFYEISPDGDHFLRSHTIVECWPEDILTGSLQGISRTFTPTEQQQYGIGRD